MTHRLTLDATLRPISDVPVRRRLIDMIATAHRRLADGDVDLVLLAARRMACVHAVLEVRSDLRDGVVNTSSASGRHVLSDRFMETTDPPVPWEECRVLILDDSVNSGATLEDRLDRLEELGVPIEAVEVDVAVRGTTPASPRVTGALVRDPLLRTPHEIHQLSRQFAALFARHRVPYFTDFPVSEEQTWSGDSFADLLTNVAWQTVDVSNTALGTSSDRTYSLLPRQPVLDALFKKVPELRDHLELAKLRVFATHDPWDVRVRVVPIVSFRPMRAADLDDWAERLGVTRGGDATRARQTVGMLTFLAARYLLGAYNTCNELPDIVEDAAISRVMLGTDVLERLGTIDLAAAHLPDVIAPEPLAPESIKWNGQVAQPSRGEMVVTGDDLVEDLYKELARSTTRDNTTSGRDEQALDFGHFLQSHDANISTVSLSIDVLNDLGSAVPKHVLQDGTVKRVYRPGEVDAFLPYDRLRPGPLGGRLARIERSCIVQLDVTPGEATSDRLLLDEGDVNRRDR